MTEKEKATGKAANDVLNMAQQVIRNYQEDCGFADILDCFIKNELCRNRHVVVCKTPNILSLGRARLELDLTITSGTINKCLRAPGDLQGHDIDVEIFKYLIYALRNPVALLHGSHKGTLVAVTDLRDKKGCPIIVSIALNRKIEHHRVNQITSAYGKDDFGGYLFRQIKKEKLIAINKNKANKLFQSFGLRLPREETFISFDNSIAYSFKNVNNHYEKNVKNKKNTVDKRVAIENKTDYANELDDILKRLNGIVGWSEDVVEMVKFFEYAGPEIRNSILWYQFQQDKDYLEDGKFAARLQDVIADSKSLAERIENTKQRFAENSVKREMERET